MGCQGPGWWWGAELELVAFLGSTGKWICALVGISSSLISDLGAELSCQLCFCDEGSEQISLPGLPGNLHLHCLPFLILVSSYQTITTRPPKQAGIQPPGQDGLCPWWLCFQPFWPAVGVGSVLFLTSSLTHCSTGASKRDW